MKRILNIKLWTFLVSLIVTGYLASMNDPARAQGVARQLGDLLSTCTVKHAYSTQQSEALGAHELGIGELAWRSCVYGGIRAKIIPNSTVPDLYKILISNDEAMTAKIQAKELTRKDRRVGNLRAIMIIQAREDQYLLRQEQQLRNEAKTADAIRAVENVLELQRRVFEINQSVLGGLR